MSAPAKFLFDVDFAARPKAEKAEPTITLAAHAAAIAEAEAKGYRNGFVAGENEAKVVADRRMATALEKISAALAALSGDLAAVEQRLEVEAVEVALAVAAKLAPELIAQEPLAEIEALVAGCFSELVATPHVVVRVADALYEQARTRFEEITRTRGYDGRLVVLGDPDMAVGDCRIEWADGGIVRDRAAIGASIAQVVSRYIAVRRDPNTPA